LLGVGNTANVEQFINDGWRLPEPIQGEFMTTVEELQARGEEEGFKLGFEQSMKTVSINMLKTGADPRFVERITGLELAVIFKLKAQLEEIEFEKGLKIAAVNLLKEEADPRYVARITEFGIPYILLLQVLLDRGMMTKIEILRTMGAEKGLEKVAVNLLKEGAVPRFVRRITGFELAATLELKARLEAM
jgi:hypothetical protein